MGERLMKELSELHFRQKLGIFLIVILLAAVWAFDAIEDLAHGSDLTHVLIEAAIILFITLWFATVTVRYFLSKVQSRKISIELSSVREDLNNYRRETAHLAKGLGQKIDDQLNQWQMTKAEKEVALLLLKGYSNKEISNIRGTAEKTTIQQVSEIYKKSGIHHRSEFSAFFLEDLLLPPS